MRTRHQLGLDVPIPGNVPPSAVVAGLLSLMPIVRHLGSMCRYEQIPVQMDVIVTDPWFIAPYKDPVFSWRLSQLITLAPGLTKEISYPIFLQRVGDKVHGRADAPAGILVWTEFSVRSKQGPSSPESTSSSATMVDEYELHEDVWLGANSLLMPFITQTTLHAHRELCVKVVEEVTNDYLKGGRIHEFTVRHM